MRAVKKRAESMERTKRQTLQKEKKSPTRNIALLNQINETRHTDRRPYRPEKNIGTLTVDYWLWILDQEPQALFGQYLAA